MTPEGKVKKKLTEILKEMGVYYTFPIGGPYSHNGTPDVLICMNGYFIGVEVKSGNNKPTALQQKNLKRIEDAGGCALTVNESNVGELKQRLEEWLESR